jgi:hypothetical protein
MNLFVRKNLPLWMAGIKITSKRKENPIRQCKELSTKGIYIFNSFVAKLFCKKFVGHYFTD